MSAASYSRTSNKPIRPKIFIVEGGIGVGKSTLCQQLEVTMKGKSFFEPVEENPFLGAFYENPKKWAFKVQTWFLNKRMQTYSEAIEHALETGEPVIVDRSVLGDYAFGLMNYKIGNMTGNAFLAYQAVWEAGWNLLLKFPPTLVIELKAKSSVCLDRIRRLRARDFELGISKEYLDGVDAEYDSVLKYARIYGQMNVIHEDWNAFDEERVNKLIQKMLMAEPPIPYTPSIIID